MKLWRKVFHYHVNVDVYCICYHILNACIPFLYDRTNKHLCVVGRFLSNICAVKYNAGTCYIYKQLEVMWIASAVSTIMWLWVLICKEINYYYGIESRPLIRVIGRILFWKFNQSNIDICLLYFKYITKNLWLKHNEWHIIKKIIK